MKLMKELNALWGKDPEKRVALIGIGSDIRGDEAAGPRVIDHLQAEGLDALLIRAESRPENFTKEIRRYNPTHVVFIQAASFGGAPGEHLLTTIEGHGGSLHESPLTTLYHFLDTVLDAEWRLLLVEPKATSVGDMTPELEEAAKRIAGEIAFTLI